MSFQLDEWKIVLAKTYSFTTMHLLTIPVAKASHKNGKSLSVKGQVGAAPPKADKRTPQKDFLGCLIMRVYMITTRKSILTRIDRIDSAAFPAVSTPSFRVKKSLCAVIIHTNVHLRIFLVISPVSALKSAPLDWQCRVVCSASTANDRAVVCVRNSFSKAVPRYGRNARILYIA